MTDLSSLADTLAADRARRGRWRSPMPAAEKWRVTLSSNQRGLIVSRKASTRPEAIAAAMRLLDDVSDMTQLHGERLSVEIEEMVG